MTLPSAVAALPPVSATDGGLGTGLVLAVAIMVPIVLGLLGSALGAWWRHGRRARGMRREQRRLASEVSAQTRLPVEPRGAGPEDGLSPSTLPDAGGVSTTGTAGTPAPDASPIAAPGVGPDVPTGAPPTGGSTPTVRGPDGAERAAGVPPLPPGWKRDAEPGRRRGRPWRRGR